MALGKNIRKDKLIPSAPKLEESEAVNAKVKMTPKSKSKTGSKAKLEKKQTKSPVKKIAKPKAKKTVKKAASKKATPKLKREKIVQTPSVEKKVVSEQLKEEVDALPTTAADVTLPAVEIPVVAPVQPISVPKFLTKEEIEIKKALKKKHDQEIVQLQGKNVQLIVFRLGSDRYALEIDNVKEIVPAPSVSKLPHAPEYVKGVANIRGFVMVILDLEEKFELFKSVDLSVRAKDYTMVIKNEKFKVGLLVNEVPTTLKVQGGVIESSSGIMSNTVLDETFIKGLIKQKDDMIILLDIIELIESEEVKIIAEAVEGSN